MLSGDLAFAAAAGTLAAVNPCGFAMLPAYLVLFGRADTVENGRVPSPGAAVRRALLAAAVMSAGFVAVFGTVGVLLTPVLGTVQRWAPVLTVAIGVVLTVLGAAVLAGRKVTLRVPGIRVPGLAETEGKIPVRVVFAYGMAYAVTSLGCAIGPFLAVAATTVRSGDLRTGVAACVVYAFGMGSVVALLAVSLVVVQRSTARPFRRLVPFAQAAAGTLVVLVGAYVTWFGVHEIRARAGADPQDRVIESAGSLQGTVARWVDALGPSAIALAVVAVALAACALGLRERKGTRR